MNQNALITIGLLLGSTIGGFIPNLWGAGMFSMSSIFFSAIGGILGLYFGFKISQM